MKFPLITIPDPAEVGPWLDREMPEEQGGKHLASYDRYGWSAMHWMGRNDGFVTGRGATPEAMLADIREKIAAADPIANLRRQAEAAGFSLVPNNPAQSPR